MRSVPMTVSRGLNTRGGVGVKPGWLLAARNSRYLPGDTQGRLWALLGRSKFNSAALPANGKAIFPFYIDGGASYLVAHAGDSLYEASLAQVGTFTLAKALGGASSRGVPFSYLKSLYYPAGPTADLGFWTRQVSGWVKGGHRTPTATFGAANQGSGSFASTTAVLYTYRIYDNTTGTESTHGPTVTKALFNTILAVRLTFAAGVTVNGERGTHLRIYRSLLGEPAGKLYRIDGSGDGIPLATVTPGYFFDDSTSNVNALLFGLVQSDGEEASQSWAEYGGPPPKARGGTIFDDTACLWGVPGFESRLFYSAKGLPECYPVDFDGLYQYYLTFSTAKQDVLMLCKQAGPYLLVFNRNSVFRVLTFPTYADAGFNRKVQDTLSPDHGCASFWGADSFGIGTQESSYCIYVSREHGPMLTNGVSDRPIMDTANWLGIVNKAAMDQIVVRNYPTLQETFIFYPGKGSSFCNQALIADYSTLTAAGAAGAAFGSVAALGLRVTGPIDVQGDDAFLGWCPDTERFYIVSSQSPYVYVQDSGAIDEQQNTNAAGDIRIEWDLPAIRLSRSLFRTTGAARVGVEGLSGTAKTIGVTVIATDGVEEYSETDTLQLGPGATDDAAQAGITGNSHRLQLRYTGPTGSNYDEADAACAPCIESVEWEAGAEGTQKRMSGA